jgi:signal transduction histidine kinase/ActR/RegA family two-component response regulator
MSSRRNDLALQALIAGFVVLAVVVASTLWLAQRQHRAVALVVHTLAVENSLMTVLSHVQDAETGQRGFLLTGRRDYLEPYVRASSSLPGDLDKLQGLTSDNPRQQASLARLRQLAAARQSALASILAAHDLDPRAIRDPAMFDRGKLLMDDIRLTVRGMRLEEEGLLRQRQEAADRQNILVTVALVISAITTVLLGIFAFADGRRRLLGAIADQEALAVSNAQLRAEAETREAAELQVRQLQKMEAIGQLTGGIAHDFNNMLAIVIGSLDMAKRRLSADLAKAEACIDNAIEGAQRAAQLTGRLLAFSRQQTLAPAALDANKLVGGMSELLRRTIGENLRVETVLSGGLWRAYADPGQLENAILNLCVNARDAMPDGGRLTVETSNGHLDDAYAAENGDVAPGQYVMVSVTDTGAGMPADVVARAFDPFYTTKGVGKGTGLGLSQVHGFVKQSGGHVKIYSEPGVGTTVKLYLPRDYGDEPARGASAETPTILPRAKGEEIILVVEDEERVRHLSVDGLRELGYTVVQASDAAQALTVLTIQPRIDLLFTDIVMPDMNGRRLADKAREHRPELKVLYTTGYTRNAVVHNGVLDANVAFLAKPFTHDQLAIKVRQVLDGHGANRPDDAQSNRV